MVLEVDWWIMITIEKENRKLPRLKTTLWIYTILYYNIYITEYRKQLFKGLKKNKN